MKKLKSNVSYTIILTIEILLAVFLALFSIHTCRRNRAVYHIEHADSTTVMANYMDYWGKSLPYEDED